MVNVTSKMLLKNDNFMTIYKQNNLCLSKRHCDVINNKLVPGF